MKKIILLLSVFLSLSIYDAKAEGIHRDVSVVLIEQDIEFVVYKNGSFSYSPLHQNSGTSINISTRSGNSIHIQTQDKSRVFVEHDRYGRISRINNVLIAYHRNNKVARIGNASISYHNPRPHVNNRVYYVNHRYDSKPMHMHIKPPHHKHKHKHRD